MTKAHMDYEQQIRIGWKSRGDARTVVVSKIVV